MAIQFTQLRYPGNNTPTFENGWSNNLIMDKNVISLGIYALPGTEFLINQDNKVKGESLKINGTGIFQINLEDRPITSLRIKENSYNNIGEHFIIIDLTYEGGLG